MGIRRSNFFPILTIILISILLIGAIGMTIPVLRYGDYFVVDFQHEAISRPDIIYGKPVAETLRNPYAILVLDVSGSLPLETDQSNIQARAVNAFFDTYIALANEVLREGETARLSIVLFGTVAEVVDWSDPEDTAEEPFLEISYQDDIQKIFDRFRRAINHFIGEKRDDSLENIRENDPRWGQDTNYDQALNATMLLLDKYEAQQDNAGSPPLVLFMTDGDFHPHQNFFVKEDYRDPVPEGVKNYYEEKGKEYFYTDRLLYVKKPGNIFDRNPEGEQGLIQPNNYYHKESDAREKMRAYVIKQVEELLKRRYRYNNDEVPIVWFPLLLNDYSATDYTASEITERQTNARSSVKKLLAFADVSQKQWDLNDRFIECKDGHMMIPSFISVLANWFRLTEVPLSKGSIDFQIPYETRSFAVYYEIYGQTGLPKLKAPNKKVHNLSGADASFGGVFSGEDLQGVWRLVNADEQTISGGTLFLRPRYDWALKAPLKVFIRESGQSIDASLQLVDIRTGEVANEPVYNKLPEMLPGKISYGRKGEEKTLSFSFERVEQTKMPRPDIYHASIEMKGKIHGKSVLAIDLSSMRENQVPFQQSKLEASFEVLRGVDIRITDERGRETGVNVTYPMASEQVKAWFRSIGE